MGVKVGVDCKLYRNTGTYGTPVWNEITLARDVKLNLEKDKAEATARLSRYKQHAAGLKGGAIEFGILADTAVDDYNSLRDAYLNDTVVDFAMADGAIATIGTQYWRADYLLFGFARGEPLAEVATVDIGMDLAYSANAPAFTTVA